MPAKGIQNTDEIIALCYDSQAALGDALKPEWKEVLDSVAEILESMKSKFFLKTNPAVPLTNVLKKSAVTLKEAADGGAVDSFGDALDKFRADMEKLLKSAKMEGIIIT